MIHRFNKFIFNEFKEYFSAYNENKLHQLREINVDPNLESVRGISKYIGVKFVFVPLTLQQEERLHRDFSGRDIGE